MSSMANLSAALVHAWRQNKDDLNAAKVETFIQYCFRTHRVHERAITIVVANHLSQNIVCLLSRMLHQSHCCFALHTAC